MTPNNEHPAITRIREVIITELMNRTHSDPTAQAGYISGLLKAIIIIDKEQ